MTSGNLLRQGRAAYDRSAWSEGFGLLRAADGRSSLAPDDLERLATAAHLTGHDQQSTDAWIRAYHGHLDRGEPHRAVRDAFWLGFGLLQRGETVQGGGWLARARRLVEEHRLDSVETGYLLVPAALHALGSGDHRTAHDLFTQAHDVGRRFRDADLAALGRLGRGQAELAAGRPAEALAGFDEAMVAVTAGEVSPVVAGIIYCAVVDGCQRAFDLRRAREWTVALTRWCDAQPGLVPFVGQCLVHRAQVLQLGGAWDDALEAAQQAREKLARPGHAAVGLADYQLGELYRLRGQLAPSEEAYRRANHSGCPPEPGLALLRLAQGQLDTAVGAVRRALDEAPDPMRRITILPAHVEIMVAAGRIDEAGAAAAELVATACEVDVAFLHGVAGHCRGAVLLAEAQPGPALEALRAGWRNWEALQAPYEAACTRVLIALACRGLGDHDGADLECDAARTAFRRLGAAPALARLAQSFPPHPDDDGRRRGTGGPEVTRREAEVLRLVASGRTNQEIAEELVISPKTVERHLSNIFTRLGLSNRAAATAYAYDHGIVPPAGG